MESKEIFKMVLIAVIEQLPVSCQVSYKSYYKYILVLTDWLEEIGWIWFPKPVIHSPL